MRPLRPVRRWARRSSTDFFRSYPDPPPVTDTNNRHQAISPLFSSPIPCSSVTPRILPVRDCCSPAKKSSAEFPFRRTIFLCLKSLELCGQRDLERQLQREHQCRDVALFRDRDEAHLYADAGVGLRLAARGKRGRTGTGLSGADRSCSGARRLRRVLPRDAQGSLGWPCECRRPYRAPGP